MTPTVSPWLPEQHKIRIPLVSAEIIYREGWQLRIPVNVGSDSGSNVGRHSG